MFTNASNLNADQRLTQQRLAMNGLNSVIQSLQTGGKPDVKRAKMIADLVEVVERLKKLGF